MIEFAIVIAVAWFVLSRIKPATQQKRGRHAA